MKHSDVNPDSSSGTSSDAQNATTDGGLDTDALADTLAEVGVEIGQTGHEMSLRGDALQEQCQEVAEALRDEDSELSDEELSGLMAEAIEAVGDVDSYPISHTKLFHRYPRSATER
jgi:pyridoxine 5'-phosphate synthase PdxJ